MITPTLQFSILLNCFSADTDGLIREEVSRTTTLPSFMMTNTQSATTTTATTAEEEKKAADENVPDDIATFYQV